MSLRFASLFSGIGAPDLAAVKLGWEHKFWCEIDPFCQQVLKYWFNNSEGYGDIRESDFSKWRGKIDVLHGSSPCQAVSISGKRRGDKDDRWLWGEMLRAICDIRPTWVTFENVANLKNMVSSNEKSIVENGEHYVLQEGMLYGIIQDLENKGYEVQSYLIPACAVGAPHERKRIWLVGYSADAGNARDEVLRGRSNKVLSGRNASEPGIERCGAAAVIGKNDRFIQNSNGTWRKVNQKGTEGSVGLARMAKMNILPTPTGSCWKVGMPTERKDGPSRKGQLNFLVCQETGKCSQLNPLFVEEMMGFPSGWILKPFQDGEENH